MKKEVMRGLILIAVLLVSCSLSSTSCSKDNGNTTPVNDTTMRDTMNKHLMITIGARSFEATLVDNATGDAFKAMLPLTIDMTELNGNEKYADLPTQLPAKALNPGTIHTGDLMLYQSNVLVLFYKNFPTSYSYTRIGTLNDTDGLQNALGSGNVKITFELK